MPPEASVSKVLELFVFENGHIYVRFTDTLVTITRIYVKTDH